MRIDYDRAVALTSNKPMTAQLMFHPRNYRANALFNMLDKLNAFSEKAVIERVSPIRFQIRMKKRNILKSIMKELGPETTELGLEFHIPQSKKIERLHNEMLNYLEAIDIDTIVRSERYVHKDVVKDFIRYFTFKGDVREQVVLKGQIVDELHFTCLDEVVIFIKDYCKRKKFAKELPEVMMMECFKDHWANDMLKK